MSGRYTCCDPDWAHGLLDNVVMVSKRWWDERAPACQAAIREAVDAGGQTTAQLTNSVIDELALPAFRDRGLTIVEPTPEDWNAMRDAVLPGIERVYVERTGERGRALVDGLRAEIAVLSE